MKKIKSPLDLLVTIVDRHKGHSVSKILNENGITYHINCIGKGTSESEVAELFGFGIIERDIVISLVASDLSKKILDILNKEFNFDERHNGLVFTIPVSSMEKRLFDLINIELGGENNG